MTIIYITIAVLAVLFIVLMVIVPEIKFNKAKKILSTFEGFKTVKKKTYDFTLENETTKVYIRLLDVPTNSMITINAKDTWVLSYGGSSKDLGRAYPNKKYVDEIKAYLKKDMEAVEGKTIYKVIVLNKCTEKIVRYLNETELAVVNPNDTVYGYKIFELTKIEEELLKLNIKKDEVLDK